MKKVIVITSIYSPSEGVKKFAEMEDYHLIVVGDKKTPCNWFIKNVDFISVSEQQNMPYGLAKELPYNHYSRKMIGYLKAIEKDADCIIDTDDDNIPKANWAFPRFSNKFECINDNIGFVNVYQLFTEQKIWPRGLPLNLISKQFDLENNLTTRECKIGIWQGLVDENPDVDAIYRLTNNTPCYFKERFPIAIGRGTVSAINTQNTVTRKELFALLYLPSTVTFRFTDILRGLIAQPIMWLYDYKLGVTNATIVQKRNPHENMDDFLSEIPMYKHTERIYELVSKSISNRESIESNIYNVYLRLKKEKIVSAKEINILETWIQDLDKAKKSLCNFERIDYETDVVI